MKINNKRENMVSFDSLNEGDVFIYLEDIYMKTERTYSNDDGDCDNVVDLKDGKLCYFKDTTMVYPVNCELVIE